jgi:hypothetical protein
MKGLEISRNYYLELVEPSLKREFPDLYPRLAAGLVGNGSDRYGFDDEISRDHDWGVDFYLWLTENDRKSVAVLDAWKTRFMNEHLPDIQNNRSCYCRAVAAMLVGDFYQQLIGVSRCPNSLNEWIRVPEEQLSLATNGEIWFDGAGAFTAIREQLLAYYPDDLRLKRMAAKCMELAQTGQYNHMRMAKRKDWVTVRFILSRFSAAAIALVFMLNKVYRPYYKWAFRMLGTLPVLGSAIAQQLESLALSADFDEASLTAQQQNIATICDLLVSELRLQGLTDSNDWFMASHGEALQKQIASESLRALPTQYEI